MITLRSRWQPERWFTCCCVKTFGKARAQRFFIIRMILRENKRFHWGEKSDDIRRGAVNFYRESCWRKLIDSHTIFIYNRESWRIEKCIFRFWVSFSSCNFLRFLSLLNEPRCRVFALRGSIALAVSLLDFPRIVASRPFESFMVSWQFMQMRNRKSSLCFPFIIFFLL